MLAKADSFGRVFHYDNWAQVRCIRRYQSHLLRLGQDVTLEQAACGWIKRYAALWRRHREWRPRAVLASDVPRRCDPQVGDIRRPHRRPTHFHPAICRN